MSERNTHSVLITFLVVTGMFLTSSIQLTSQQDDTDRAYLGVRAATVHKQMQLPHGSEVKHGVLVKHVLPNTPAARAGLQQFDVIRKLNGASISSLNVLSREIDSRSAGDTVRITVLRNGNTKTVQVKLGTYGAGTSPEEANELDPDRKKMNKVLKSMEKAERGSRLADRGSDSARTPDSIREEFKSFLEEHPPEAIGNNDKNEDKTSSDTQEEFEKLVETLRKRLKKSLGDELSPEQVEKIMDELRNLVQKTTDEEFHARLKKYMNKMKKMVKALDGDTGKKLREWRKSIQKQFEKQLSNFEDRLDKKMNRFEKRIERRMKKYSEKLEDEIEDEVKELLQEAIGEDEKEEESQKDRGQERSDQPYLGIRPATDPAGEGVLIREVEPDSPAERAGLKKGDVIRKLNDKTLDNVNNLQKTFYRFEPGDKIELLVERDGWKRIMEIKLGRKSDEANESSSSSSGSSSRSEESSFGQKSYSFQEKMRKDLLRNGKRAIWMYELYNDFERGNYLDVLKKAIRRGMDVIKKRVRETPMRLNGRITLRNEETGDALFSMSINQSLTRAVHRMDRVIAALIGK